MKTTETTDQVRPGQPSQDRSVPGIREGKNSRLKRRKNPSEKLWSILWSVALRRLLKRVSTWNYRANAGNRTPDPLITNQKVNQTKSTTYTAASVVRKGEGVGFAGIGVIWTSLSFCLCRADLKDVFHKSVDSGSTNRTWPIHAGWIVSSFRSSHCLVDVFGWKLF